MVNWTVRFKNPDFWAAFIPALYLLVKTALTAVGEIPELGDPTFDKIMALMDAFMVFLMAIGVINDPTTEGLSDSKRAMRYSKPNSD